MAFQAAVSRDNAEQMPTRVLGYFLKHHLKQPIGASQVPVRYRHVGRTRMRECNDYRSISMGDCAVRRYSFLSSITIIFMMLSMIAIAPKPCISLRGIHSTPILSPSFHSLGINVKKTSGGGGSGIQSVHWHSSHHLSLAWFGKVHYTDNHNTILSCVY